jgi:hypothetical protein
MLASLRQPGNDAARDPHRQEEHCAFQGDRRQDGAARPEQTTRH